MKCTIEIDCTPLEARQFFGLPDVQPMQATVMAELERKMMAEMERVSPDAIMKNWFTFFSQAPDQMGDIFSKMMLAASGGAKRS
ncbi:MAG: hypothetical protein INR63_26860 [Actinomycetospora chiangmaiensis]|nr:hypothetical protein [Actinomycetospora chiangmaiensis]